MKKLLHTLLLFAVGLFAACQAPTSGGDVYLNDFLDDLTAQTDAGPAIRAFSCAATDSVRQKSQA